MAPWIIYSACAWEGVKWERSAVCISILLIHGVQWWAKNPGLACVNILSASGIAAFPTIWTALWFVWWKDIPTCSCVWSFSRRPPPPLSLPSLLFISTQMGGEHYQETSGFHWRGSNGLSSLIDAADIFALVRYNTQSDSYRWVSTADKPFISLIWYDMLWL